MEQIFVDTGAWFAFFNRGDPDHETVADDQGDWEGRLLTSDYVFDELVTLIPSPVSILLDMAMRWARMNRMLRRNLNLLCKKRRLNQSDLARLAGISRQAVSLWFKKEGEFIDVRSRSLDRLCRGLDISPDELLRQLPELESAREYRAQFLWDRLYPDLESFALALSSGDLRAIGRLTQVWGLYRSAKVVGNVVWREFERYAKYIAPPQRRKCELVWALHVNRT